MNTLAKSGPNGLPIATPSTCWYKRLLKTKWQFITDSDRSTDYVNGVIHRNIGEQGSDIKLAMTTLLESMSLFKGSWTKEKESVIMRELVVRGVKSGTKNLSSLHE